MSLTLPPRSPDEPKSHWLYRALCDAILRGRLQPGDRLPPSRDLAKLYGVSRGLVVDVYEQLIAEGYADGRFGGGTVVRESLPQALLGELRTSNAPPPPRPSARASQIAQPSAGAVYTAGAPAFQPRAFTAFGSAGVDLFPREIWARLMRQQLLADTMAQLHDPGSDSVRGRLADYLRTHRGVVCEPEQIFLTSVIGNALEAALLLLLDPGAAMWLEDPGQPMVVSIAAQAGIEVVPVPVDRDGLDVEVAHGLRPDARFAFVTPSRQELWGTPMSLARRLALVDWAERKDGWVFEADQSSELRYAGRPLRWLQAHGSGDRVFHSGSFLQLLFPAVRITYLVVPRALVDLFQRARTNLLLEANPLLLATLDAFMAEGHFDRHLRRRREAFRKRLAVFRTEMRAQLGDLIQLDEIETGTSILGWLAPGLDPHAIVARAAAVGIIVQTPDMYLLQRRDLKPALLFGFAAIDAAKIPEAVRRLAGAVRA